MKRNKPETHFRLKPYLRQWIQEIARQSGSTMTSVVEDALEKGLTWRIKMIRKELDPNFLKKEEQAQEQQNNKPQTNVKTTQQGVEAYEEETERLVKKLGLKNKEELYKLAKTKWVPKK